MKHTNGPWEFNKDRTCLTANDIKIIDVNTGVEPTSIDARLIVNAPNMLEMLNRIYESGLLDGKLTQDVVALISKVEGL